MLDKDGKRMLAYIQEVLDVQPIEGADNIEKAHVLGWTLIIKKGEFKPGDKCVFFEIDSKVPPKSEFEFLSKRGYKIRTYKLNKFNVISQGLIMPLETFGIDSETPINTDMTETLGVTYAVAEDNFRKLDVVKLKQKQYMNKHKKFFNNRFIKWLMKFKMFRKLLLRKATKSIKTIKKTAFPSNYVSKTDEERIQNMPFLLEDKTPLIATEKIDGTSTTFLLVRKKHKKFEFYVCTRNKRLFNDGNDEIYLNQDNIYYENAIKYDIENQLKKYLNEHKDLDWVCIQGESYGEGWQGNPLKMKGHHFAAFNFKDSKNGRWNSLEGKKLLESFDKPIPWVPILDENFILPDTVEELLKIATAKSQINPEVLREGIVFRGKDGQLSFKAVSPEYLIKHNS